MRIHLILIMLQYTNTKEEKGIIINFHPPLFMSAIKIVTSAQIECKVDCNMKKIQTSTNEENEPSLYDNDFNENIGSLLNLSENLSI